MAGYPGRLTRSLAACAGFLIASSGALSASEQRSCNFNAGRAPDGPSFEADWTVIAAQNQTAGRIVVQGSGDYTGKAHTKAAGATAYAFRTPVSKESITVSPGRDAFWLIDFDDGRVMAYFGCCNRPRRTG